MRPVAQIATVFPLTVAAMGCIGILAGCGSPVAAGPNSSAVPLSAGGATQVYISQPALTGDASGSVVQFPIGASDNISPTTTIATPPSNVNSYVAADKEGQLYVGTGTASPKVLVFRSGASGTASPARTILASAASFSDAGPLAVDSESNLYVVDPAGSISVFSPTANGAATPEHHIQGSLTQLADAAVPNAISVDALGNIYVSLASTSPNATAWKILVFSPSAEGNVAPSRVITAENNCSLDNAFQVALDASGNFYAACIVANETSITEFAWNGSSVAAPVKTITCAATDTVAALSVDSAGNIFAVFYTQNQGLSLEAFGAAGSGNVTPAVRFTSGSLTSVFPQLALR